MTVRWGIAGSGRIARIMATEFTAAQHAELVAVGSRSAERAGQFAAEFGLPHAHGSYRELLDDPDVDAIYIGTPNAQHYALALAVIGANKAVLVEKSMTCQVQHTRELARAARQEGVFAMEGMWTRFLPAIRAAHEAVATGRIGDITCVQGDLFAYRAFNATDRLFAPGLGGGAMLDLGVYALHFAQDFLGEPIAVDCTGQLAETRVDASASMQLRYASGATAQLSISLQAHGPGRMTIMGTDGFIEVEPRFHHLTSIVVHRDDDEPEHVTLPFPGRGYRLELSAVSEAIEAGLTEHPFVPLDDSIAVAGAMTHALEQLGYRPLDDEDF
ncbi:Oxidoreductase, NAD-binding domain protein [Propionibacterium freudenreichii]|uniref:Gfo/Idh/MocA family protein n=1 Tax=Propionibacterium freudenreichii TaxID=1744 RepID=UPI000BC2F407|nr:Gfo/Idh/MocA family oxidoreductase [Propionibacterium freudenreichii]SBN60767.1 Oxidoreductase, NAD-binding domain protein [Propionibacterium freudenreichii]SCQ49660.1 Oxidoreductase, NAD-binding domain protein [Propionibacterium freudenreichii]SCQ55154.1 Oxidoreductase, NAD-binding domain protein [Propionibacterium freudenreichii]